jgi:ParB family transcriptional regulator, chromosome partitioning protein
MHANIPLSQLVAGRFNPRRVKPQRDAHRKMVASIRAHGLLEPLIVRPAEEPDQYVVMAGGRRLAALREVYRGKDPKIGCQIRGDGDPEAISLAENFVREPMHPLDEAEAFARLIREEDKDVATVASNFGVTPAYVRQRIKLATLCDPVKAAYRDNGIDTGTAEAFAAVPEDKQLEVWQELDGSPSHAEHVRKIISNAWIDAKNALFDITTLPPEKVSRDLFGDRVLVERQAFFTAQSEALIAKQKSLQEEGWSEVVVASQNDVHDRLWRMDEAPVVLDEVIAKKLIKLDEKRGALEAQLEKIDGEDHAAREAHQKKVDALDEQQDELTKDVPVQYTEAVKAVGTVFLILGPDGQVRTQCRVPKARSTDVRGDDDGSTDPNAPPIPPTSDDLSDKQLASLFTAQALAVRQSLLESSLARKRVLVLLLHRHVRSGALAMHHDANETNDYADRTEGFACPALDALRSKRAELDPFSKDNFISDTDAYGRLMQCSETQLDELISLLTVEFVTANLARPTELVGLLATELAVDLRKQWRPDATWLGCYQKLQLSQLIATLRGPAYDASADRKKSELLEIATAIFAGAAEGHVTDPDLKRRANAWLPKLFLQHLEDLPAAPAESDGNTPDAVDIKPTPVRRIVRRKKRRK